MDLTPFLAGESDNEELLAFHRAHGIDSGALSIRYDRAPDFFSLIRCRGDATVLRRRTGKRIDSLASFAIRRGYLHGREENVGYLGELRVSQRRRSLLEWRQLYGELLEHAARHLGTRYFITSILDANALALNALTSSHAAFVYEPLVRYRMVNVIAGLLPSRPRFRIRRAEETDREALFAFLDRMNRRKPFGYTSAEWPRRLESWPGYSLDRFFLLFDGDEIRGTTAVWNAAALQRIVLERLPLPLEIIRRTLIRTRTLEINYLTALELDFAGDERVAAFRELLAAIRRDRDLPRAHMLTFCDYEPSSVRRALRGMLHQTVPATLYTVRHIDTPALEVDASNGVGFEIALV